MQTDVRGELRKGFEVSRGNLWSQDQNKYVKKVTMGWQGDMVSSETVNEYQSVIRVPASTFVPLLERQEQVIIRFVDFKSEFIEFQIESARLLDVIAKAKAACE